MRRDGVKVGRPGRRQCLENVLEESKLVVACAASNSSLLSRCVRVSDVRLDIRFRVCEGCIYVANVSASGAEYMFQQSGKWLILQKFMHYEDPDTNRVDA